MTAAIDRRKFLGAGLAAGAAALAMPGRVFATPLLASEQHRRILSLAKAQVERLGSQLCHRDLAAIADFGLASAEPRFHFADLVSGQVRSFLVAHGRGSDPEHDGFLKSFSNLPGSYATSRGGFVTTEFYQGKYGTSIRLGGADQSNSNAYERAIVVHPAWYANPDMIAKWGKLGRSEGCFAMAEGDIHEAIEHLGVGRLIYADRLGIA